MPLKVTEEQYELLVGATKAKVQRAPGAPRVKKRPEDLPENQVKAQILGVLRARGWTVIRQQSGVFRRMFGDEVTEARITVGERGCADWRAERPVIPYGKRPSQGPFLAELFYLEIKAPGRVPSSYQLKWLRDRNAVGFTAVWFDSLHDFLKWYEPRFSK